MHMDTDEFSGVIRGCGGSLSGREDRLAELHMSCDGQAAVCKDDPCGEEGGVERWRGTPAVLSEPHHTGHARVTVFSG